MKISETSSKDKIVKREIKVKKHWKKVVWDEMQRIPAGEEDLIDVAVFINMLNSKPVDLMSVNEIKSPALQKIYLGKPKEALDEFDKLMQKKNWE